MHPMVVFCLSLLVAQGEMPKTHRDTLLANEGVTPILERTGFATGREPGDPKVFTKTIYGYLPYWTEDSEHIPWEHLTHLSYFNVAVNADGTLGSSHSWNTDGAALVETGHSYGVQVTLTATLFDDADIGTLLSSATYRTTLINELVALVDGQGGDGVNIDFEFVPSSPASAKANFVTLMTDLTDTFHAQIPGSHVSLATPAVDWNGTYDYDELAIHSDGMMIMGYGYHWSGGNPGPCSPIDTGDVWPGRSLSWTVDDYIEWGGNENRDKFILGFPLYGRDWPSQSGVFPGVATADGAARQIWACEDSFAIDKSWEPVSETPYRVYNDGQTRQLWCEDAASLEAKLDLVAERDIGGAMFWALGYASNDHAVWAGIDERFVLPPDENAPPVAIVTGPATSTVGEMVWLDGTASYDPDGETLSYQWRALDGPVVAITNDEAALASVTPTEAGYYRFALAVSDAAETVSADLSVTVVPVGQDGGPVEQDAGPVGGDSASPPPGDSGSWPWPSGDPGITTQVPIDEGCGCQGTASPLLWLGLWGVWGWRKRGNTRRLAADK